MKFLWNHYAPGSQVIWCNVTYTVGNLFLSHGWDQVKPQMGFEPASTVWKVDNKPTELSLLWTLNTVKLKGYEYTYVHVYMCTYIHTYICMSICRHIFTHTHTSIHPLNNRTPTNLPTQQPTLKNVLYVQHPWCWKKSTKTKIT